MMCIKISKVLDEAHVKYATIEKELLAVCFGCNRFHDYIFSKYITVQTDHKLLVSIMVKPIHKLSPCIQQMWMRLQNYDLPLTHIEGTIMFIADALSWAHSHDTG